MLVLIIALIASFIPPFLLYLWLRNKNGETEEYGNVCRKALINGILSVIAVILVSALCNIILALLISKQDHFQSGTD